MIDGFGTRKDCQINEHSTLETCGGVVQTSICVKFVFQSNRASHPAVFLHIFFEFYRNFFEFSENIIEFVQCRKCSAGAASVAAHR